MADTIYFDRAHIGFKATGGTSTQVIAVDNPRSSTTIAMFNPQTIDTNCYLESGYFYGFKGGNGTQYAQILVYDYGGVGTSTTIVASSDELNISSTAETLQKLSFPAGLQLTSGKDYILGLALYTSGGTNGTIRVTAQGGYTVPTGASYRITGGSWVRTVSPTGGADYANIFDLWVTYTGGVTTTGLSEQRMMLVPTSDDFIGYYGTGTTNASGVGGSGNHYSYVNEWETFATTQNYIYTTGGTTSLYNLYNFSVPTGNQQDLGDIIAVRVYTTNSQHGGTASSGSTILSISGSNDTGTYIRPATAATAVSTKEYLTNPFNGTKWNWPLISSLKAGSSAVSAAGITGSKAYATWIDVIYKPFLQASTAQTANLDEALLSAFPLDKTQTNINLISTNEAKLNLNIEDISTNSIYNANLIDLLINKTAQDITANNINLINLFEAEIDVNANDIIGLFTNISSYLNESQINLTVNDLNFSSPTSTNLIEALENVNAQNINVQSNYNIQPTESKIDILAQDISIVGSITIIPNVAISNLIVNDALISTISTNTVNLNEAIININGNDLTSQSTYSVNLNESLQTILIDSITNQSIFSANVTVSEIDVFAQNILIQSLFNANINQSQIDFIINNLTTSNINTSNLTEALLNISAQDITTQVSNISATETNAQLDIIAQTLSILNQNSSSISEAPINILASDVSVIKGAVSALLDYAQIDFSTQGVGPSSITASLNEASIITDTLTISITTSAISRILDEAKINFEVQDVTALIGSVSRVLQEAQLLLNNENTNSLVGSISSNLANSETFLLANDITSINTSLSNILLDNILLNISTQDITTRVPSLLDFSTLYFYGNDLLASNSIITPIPSICLTAVSGGLFVNLSNYINYAISSYASGIGQVFTLRDGFPIDDTKLTAPLVCYSFDFATYSPIQIGDNHVSYTINFLIDVIGKTKVERDKLTRLVFWSLEKAPPCIEGFGDVNLEKIDLVDTFYINKEKERFNINSLIATLNASDFTS